MHQAACLLIGHYLSRLRSFYELVCALLLGLAVAAVPQQFARLSELVYAFLQ